MLSWLIVLSERGSLLLVNNNPKILIVSYLPKGKILFLIIFSILFFISFSFFGCSLDYESDTPEQIRAPEFTFENLSLTKIDKGKQREVDSNISVFKKRLLETWEDVPVMLRTSSVTHRGKDDILNLIDEINTMFKPQENNQ